ncbi:MAG TPA: xanthine dehydrogenase molybdopterin binding subunit [Ramlibacter sp.]|nr:xanthine dehydrogenase molybdopterin binding subunit [Ramlibacter sp.]
MTAGPASGAARPHESARAHVAGSATYIDDIPEVKGTLHAAPILSTVAHGRLRGVDASVALSMPGVRGVVLAADIPGDPVLATFVHDEPVFAFDKVEHIGQVIGVIVADTVMHARRAARKAQVSIDALPAVLTPREAHAAKSYVLPPVVVRRGEPERALDASAHRLSGQLEVGGQEHFYLEGQVAYALPLEQGQWRIHSSTQHPGEVQHWVAHALGLENNAVTVECRRMGGGFGGKETQAGQMAVWAALAARKFKCPVKLRLDRDDDFMITGKRHPFAYDYIVGFDDSGLITALKLTMLANCGFSADLSGPVADRAIFHSDNAYFLSDVEIASYRCKTNTQSNTAFRGFGGPQGVIAIEAILGDIARHLELDPLDVRMRNLYGVEDRNVTHYQMKVEDNILRPLISKLERTSNYRMRREQIAAWNAKSPVIKRGIAITPVKFGISFTATFFNQAGALVHVYTDGSVQVNHGGTEMGQGLNTKVAQLVADELGVPFERVRSTAADTSKVPNASATAASSGFDLNGRAAQYAARNVRDNLAAFVSGLDGCGAGAVSFKGGQVISPKSTRTFDEVVKAAYANRIQLWSDGFYRTPKIHYDKITLTGRPFYYFSYGAACSEVAMDTLTGESRVLKVDILHDVGASINPAIDLGQIEGGFIQGVGWLTTEQLVWNDQGHLATHAPSTYKIPATGDVPAHFKIDLWPEPNREDNVFGSKAVGEPPLMLAISVWEALRDAVAALPGKQPVRMQAPATPENVLAALRSRSGK